MATLQDMSQLSFQSDALGSLLPPAFCWTKMGAESGQGLSAILRRKELEREAGSGVFSWGIGNSVGPALDYARSYLTGATFQTLFTAMKSAPKSIDVAPESLVMWRGFHDGEGNISPLPEHMLITSRQHGPSGAEKQIHYALICRRNRPLEDRPEIPDVDGTCTRNLVSAGRVGYSQVTSVVRYDPSLAEANGRQYPVVFDAELTEQWFVRLAEPVPIIGKLASLYEEACLADNAKEWAAAIQALNSSAESTLARLRPSQRMLFDH